jgi:hypothetical protein
MSQPDPAAAAGKDSAFVTINGPQWKLYQKYFGKPILSKFCFCVALRISVLLLAVISGVSDFLERLSV